MGEEHLTSCHSKSEEGENDFSAEARISPILTVPKNPVVAAAQITCLSRAGQEVAAILLPRVIRRGNVIALLVLGWLMKLVPTYMFRSIQKEFGKFVLVQVGAGETA